MRWVKGREGMWMWMWLSGLWDGEGGYCGEREENGKDENGGEGEGGKE